MKPEHRSALLSLASRRGQKGFSAVLSDAIESYLRQEEGREKRRKNCRRFADRFQVTIGDPIRTEVINAFRRIWLAVQEHLPRILLLKAADDLDQGRLPRPVVSQ